MNKIIECFKQNAEDKDFATIYESLKDGKYKEGMDAANSLLKKGIFKVRKCLGNFRNNAPK